MSGYTFLVLDPEGHPKSGPTSSVQPGEIDTQGAQYITK